MTRHSRAEILAVVRREIYEVQPDAPRDIPESAAFRADLGFDSLELAEYVARMEQAFRVEVPDEEWQSLSTLARVADYIQARLP